MHALKHAGILDGWTDGRMNKRNTQCTPPKLRFNWRFDIGKGIYGKLTSYDEKLTCIKCQVCRQGNSCKNTCGLITEDFN